MLIGEGLIEELNKLPADWHGSGSMSENILNAILHYAGQMKEINFTAETGAGKTTLLFSNLSKNHVVFSLDNWDSLSAAKRSNLLVKDNIEFIEGPTQNTLPHYKFNQKFDIVLLDGPHGYPFPDLEYFYFYPHITNGGLLLIDDIHIPSISRMYEILKNDDMWILLDKVEKLAVFKRSEAALIDPLSDSWWLQGYNKSLFNKMQIKQKFKNWIPKWVYPYLPGSLKKSISKLFQ